MTENQTKIMKLSSGEEIICNVISDEHPRTLSVKMPMKVMTVPKVTSNGIEEALSLTRWIHFTETDVYDVPKTQVLAMADASLGMKRFYEYCIDKLEQESLGEINEPSDSDLSSIEDEDDDYSEELSEWEPNHKVYH